MSGKNIYVITANFSDLFFKGYTSMSVFGKNGPEILLSQQMIMPSPNP